MKILKVEGDCTLVGYDLGPGALIMAWLRSDDPEVLVALGLKRPSYFVGGNGMIPMKIEYTRENEAADIKLLCAARKKNTGLLDATYIHYRMNLTNAARKHCFTSDEAVKLEQQAREYRIEFVTEVADS